MTYPDYQNSRLIVNGVDITTAYQLILVDGYTLSPPEPVTYYVDVPGRNGPIDLTESLTSDVQYKNRTQTFIFDLLHHDHFEMVKTALANFIHGREYDYQISWDPGYTYHGRFRLEEFRQRSEGSQYDQLTLSVDANPYKSLGMKTYYLNCTGGRLLEFPSGRRPVHPIVQSDRPIIVADLQGNEYEVPRGTHSLRKITFKNGVNQIYICSAVVYTTDWDFWDENGTKESVWDDLKAERWYDLQRFLLDGNRTYKPRSWDDLRNNGWESQDGSIVVTGVAQVRIPNAADLRTSDQVHALTTQNDSEDTLFTKKYWRLYKRANVTWDQMTSAGVRWDFQSIGWKAERVTTDINEGSWNWATDHQWTWNDVIVLRTGADAIYHRTWGVWTPTWEYSPTWDHFMNVTWDELNWVDRTGNAQVDNSNYEVILQYSWEDL